MIANLDGLNKAFESKIRLGIMSVLMANESVGLHPLREEIHRTQTQHELCHHRFGKGCVFCTYSSTCLICQ